MAKKIIDPESTRTAILRGLNKQADAVRASLGMKHVRQEDATSTREIQLPDPLEDLGAQIVRQAAKATVEDAGGGAATTAVLAQAILRQGSRDLAAGADPLELRRGISLAVRTAAEEIDRLAQPADLRDIARVGALSATDEEIGRLVATALERVGKDGIVRVEESPGAATSLEVIEGVRLEGGFLSPYFCTDDKGKEAVLDRPKVLLCAGRLEAMSDLLPVLEEAARQGRSLLVIADFLGNEALATLVVNKLRGVLRVAAMSPLFYDSTLLDDLALLTGGEVAASAGELRWEDLGEATRAVLTEDETTITFDAEEPRRRAAINGSIERLRAEIAEASDFVHWPLERRLSRLTGGIAVIHVGGVDEAARSEKRARIELALEAARGALQEGIVPGGGVAYLRASQTLEGLTAEGDVRKGIDIVRHALTEPARQIAINSGKRGSDIVKKILATTGSTGYNARTGKLEDLTTAGVIDSATVATTALRNAAGIYETLLDPGKSPGLGLGGSARSSARMSYGGGGYVAYAHNDASSGFDFPSGSGSPGRIVVEHFAVVDGDPVYSLGRSGAVGSPARYSAPPPLTAPGTGQEEPPAEKAAPEPPEAANGGDDTPPDKRINIWIAEQEEAPDRWIVPGEMVTLCFKVGEPLAASLVSGDATRVPLADIPEAGLPTEWVISSRTVMLIPGTNELIGGKVTSKTTFSLLIPRQGESEVMRLKAIPQPTEEKTRIDVLVYVRGTLYRQLEVEIDLFFEVEVRNEMTYRLPDEIGRQPAQDWARAPGSLQITVSSSQTHLRGRVPTVNGLWEPNRLIAWPPRKAELADLIAQLRAAAEAFREECQEDLDDIPAADFERRLQALSDAPGGLPADWEHLPDMADEDHRQAWERISRHPRLRDLAFQGYALYQALFETPFQDEPEIRSGIAGLRPGSRLDVNWLDTIGEAWTTHVPWGLLYQEEPPPDQPVDPAKFFGLRYRISYIPYQVPTPRGALGRPESVWAAHCLYWGTGDAAGTESQWQRSRWSRWPNQVIVPLDPAEREAKSGIRRLLTAPEKQPMAVLYFFCRSAEGTGENDLVLRFGGSSRDEDNVRPQDLGLKALPDRPLVFANACATAAAEPYIANGLELAFIKKRGCRAFLGTEAKVPIVLASRFAATFFHFFFRQVGGEPVSAGEAVAQARLFLWTQYRNLGGLFYCLVNKHDLYMADEQEILALPA